MATLEEALYGLNFTPAENPYGIAATQIGQLGPKLINPYGSTGQAVGIGLGTILLQSLLGYQARSQAAQETLQLNTLANQMQELTSAQARTDFITGVEDPIYQSRLSTLATALGAQERARKAKADEKLLEMTAGYEAQLSPKGTEVFEREQNALLRRALSLRSLGENSKGTSAKPEKDWWEKIPAAQKAAFTSTSGQVQQLRNLAEQFRELDANAIELNIQKQIPNTKADLAMSAMQTLVPSTVKMLGDTGALSAYDQEAVKRATLGGRLSGSQSIASRLDQLANLAETKTITSLEQYKTAAESGGTGLLERLTTGQSLPSETPIVDVAAEKRKEALREEIQQLKLLLSQRAE